MHITIISNGTYIRLQVGACPLHFPLLMHLLVELPCNLNPGLHLYLAMEPGLFPLTLTDPYLGGRSLGQVRATIKNNNNYLAVLTRTEMIDIVPRLQVGACPLHFPLLMHLLVELPCNLNPGLHLYLAMEPGLFPLTLTDPYLGGRSLGQVRATIKNNNNYLAVLTRTEMIDIVPRLQVGACPLHFPLLMHLLVELPCNLNPGLHLYLAMEPGLFPLTLTDPYLGGRSLGQVRATIKNNNNYLAVLTRTEMIDIVPRLQVGACPLHFPLLMHLLVELPCNLNPGLHLYLAMEPGLFPLTLTDPYLGGRSLGQVRATIKQNNYPYGYVD